MRDSVQRGNYQNLKGDMGSHKGGHLSLGTFWQELASVARGLWKKLGQHTCFLVETVCPEAIDTWLCRMVLNSSMFLLYTAPSLCDCGAPVPLLKERVGKSVMESCG